MWGQSLTELFQKGGICMWPLLACSIAGVAIILERTLVLFWLRSRFPPLVGQLRSLIVAGRLEQAEQLLARKRNPVARVAAAYLSHRDSPDTLREEVVGREASQQLVVVERHLNWLAMVVQVAPLLGLLGTVTGLVTAFHEIELRSGQVVPGDLAAGIWEALLTTVYGLVMSFTDRNVPCLTS